MTPPFFSVIIPTYNRPGPLAACLRAVARLDYPRDRFEVIVVDDGSPASPAAVVAPFRDVLALTLLRQANAGPAAARNTGAARARGEFLAFTDDDCAPATDWLQALAARFAASPAAAVGGRTANTLEDNPCSTASQLLLSYLYAYYRRAPARSEPGQFFATMNLAVPAAAFRALGGFDTRFPLAAGEDREFCYRWQRQGHALAYAPEVLVYHTHPLTPRSFWRQHLNYGRGAFHFHRSRMRGRGMPLRPEPLAFYLDLLRYPLLHSGERRVFLLAALLALSQLANAAGFLEEEIKARGEARRLVPLPRL